MEEKKKTESNQNEIICGQCGAKLTFAPGTDSLACEYCGNVNEIKVEKVEIEEIDFLDFINSKIDTAPKIEVVTIKCDSCGAETTFDENVVSESCEFCAAPLVATNKETSSLIAPKSLLPFKIVDKDGIKLYQTWLKKLWWAPNDLKKYARQKGKLTGIYIPYWTYDSDTSSDYSGERGDDYQDVESYTNSEGEEETRTVTRTVWSYVSGRVNEDFDDILVVASKSLPLKYIEELEPWDLTNLAPFDSKFLSGFKTESYQIDLKDGFEICKDKMEDIIRSSIRDDIGGDHQRINSLSTHYYDITFKHILLPIWISTYRFNNKAYRFMINGRTGEVQGERPYSWIKITLAVIAAIIAIVTILYLVGAFE